MRTVESSAEATRQRIEQAAEELFRTIGYQKTAVADIARALGMSPANIYRFFPSKSAINEAIAQRLLGALREEAHGIVVGPGTAAERLRRLLSMLFERKVALFFAERRLHDMVTVAMTEHWSVIEDHIRAVEQLLLDLLANGAASGEFVADAVSLGPAIHDAIVGHNHPVVVHTCLVQQGRSLTEMRAAVSGLTDLLLRALRP